MLSRRLRLTIREASAVVALLAAVLAFCIVPVARHIERENKKAEHRRVAGELGRALKALENHVPPGVSPSVWACALRETMTCQFNVCLRPDFISIDELYLLREDLMAKMRGPVDLKT